MEPTSSETMDSLVGDVQDFGAGTMTSSHDISMPFPYPLAKFYNDSPWPLRNTHPGPIPENQNLQQLSPLQHTGPNFQVYRSSHVPSEADTNADGSGCGFDSGYYGSRAPTINHDNTSLLGDDRNLEAQQATNLVGAMCLNPDYSNWSRPGAATDSSSGDHRFTCHECHASLRTKSEMKKHDLKHNKPYRCEVPGCARNGGFSTRNDLDRHKRSVHSDASVSGRRFICRHGTCSTKDKVWPRADNFRSHLSRIHEIKKSAEDDLGEYLYTQPLHNDLQGIGGTTIYYLDADPQALHLDRAPNGGYPQSLIGSQSMEEDAKHGLTLTPQLPPQLNATLDTLVSKTAFQHSEPDSTNLASVHEGDERLMQPDMLSGRPPTSMAPSQLFGSQSISDSLNSFQHTSRFDKNIRSAVMSQPSMSQASISDECDTDAEGSVAEPPEIVQAEKQTQNDESEKGEDGSRASFLALMSSCDEKTILECLKTLSPDLLQQALEQRSCQSGSGASSQESSGSKDQFPCTECRKAFNRQCELRKHMKRHEKPYGCTWPECSKTFGSKNDWKRHESIQHYQLEKWRCQEIDAETGRQCTKVCHRRESFRSHLQSVHSVKEAKKLDERLDKCRIGRHCDRRFWCGFCKKHIDIDDETGNAWTRRFNHIDDHFCGRDGGHTMNISQWKHEVVESSDENEKHHPGHGDGRSASSLRGARKRKTSTDSAAEPSKKSRAAGATRFWGCCRCEIQSSMTKISSHCFMCNHRQCCNCSTTLEEVEDQ